jgi:cytochrome b subunit of formate dehydrogenase
MARHYFLFGPRPPLTEPYNPLQKLAYTSTLAFGAVSVLTGLVLFKPAQLSPLAFIFGGYRAARVWHFAAMCGLLAFIPGHLLMVALHGWDNFAGMFTGWKRNPEYLSGPESTPVPSALAAGAQPATEGEQPEEASTELAPSREETDGDD